MLMGTTLLVLTAFRAEIVYYFSPAELIARGLSPGKTARLGGLVLAGSVEPQRQGLVHFRVGDRAANILVVAKSPLPDLFREGQGVVVDGRLDPQGQFIAQRVLAKHDEKYIPKEVVATLKKNGEWRGSVKP